MLLLIASDLHGSAYYTRGLFEAFERERADRMLLLGDLLYHGPRNDLPREYSPKEVLSTLNRYSSRILCVRGNCDAEVDQMVLDFPILADYGILPLEKRLVFFTHGHLFSKERLPSLQPGDLLLHGHTHVPAWQPLENGFLYLNPGSVSIPKESSPHSYMTFDGSVFLWKDLDGAVFHQLSC